MNRFEFYGNIEAYKRHRDELKHYGTIGQKWGVRKWQNPDGTFNEAGKERYFGSKGKKEKNEKKINSKYQNKDGSLSQEYINKIQKLTNEGKFDEIEKLKKQIDFDKVQEWSKKANPNLYKIPDFSDPSEYEGDFESYVEDNWETAAKKRGFDPDNNLTDEQYEIINNDLKKYFNNEQKIGSISKPKVKAKYLNEDGTLNEEGKARVHAKANASATASAVFKILKWLKIAGMPISAIGGISLAAMGAPATFVVAALAGLGIQGLSATGNHIIAKKLENRSSNYYKMLNGGNTNE